jgi:hypothetical protein
MSEEKNKSAAVVNLQIVRQAVDGAVAVNDGRAAASLSEPPARTREARGRDIEDQSTAPPPPGKKSRLPDGCPVIPLGQLADTFFYLDAAHQLAALKGEKHGKLNIATLFGRMNYLLAQPGYWPRFGRDGKVNGFAADHAAHDLMAAAAAEGLWKPQDKVRGPGAWAGTKGELILHCGDVIFIQSCGARGDSPARLESHKPGMIGGKVYPAAEAGPRPALERQPPGEAGPGEALLRFLRTWPWKRPEVHPNLMLGWIVAALAGGALKWRPVVWITGGPGTGKSTLQEVLRHVLNDWLVSVSDASAAGIWQKLGYATLPVALDEIEADADNRRADAVIKLARQAASGGLVLRGGQNHEGTEFVARSCFLFSSIVIPPLEPQDLSRMAILELMALPQGSIVQMKRDWLRGLGPALIRRLVDQWGRMAETMEIYRAALAEVGHNARGCDQFGTLLACADLALYDAAPDGEQARATAARLDAKRLDEWAEQVSDEFAMLNKLVTFAIEPHRGGSRRSVGAWIEQAAGLGGNAAAAEDAETLLRTHGLSVHGDEGGATWLAMANAHSELEKIFAGTKWAGRAGKTGGWRQSARRLPGAVASRQPIYFGGPNLRATLIPIEIVLPGRKVEPPSAAALKKP